MRKYNEEAFTPDEVEKGLHIELLNTLLSINSKRAGEAYYDIHITSDGYCTIIQWDTVFDGVYGEDYFQYVDENQVIMTEVTYPDNSYEYVFPEEADHALEKWLKEHPEWHRNDLGMWTDSLNA